jgi:hypothetical protein
MYIYICPPTPANSRGSASEKRDTTQGATCTRPAFVTFTGPLFGCSLTKRGPERSWKVIESVFLDSGGDRKCSDVFFPTWHGSSNFFVIPARKRTQLLGYCCNMTAADQSWRAARMGRILPRPGAAQDVRGLSTTAPEGPSPPILHCGQLVAFWRPSPLEIGCFQLRLLRMLYTVWC